MDIYSYLKKDHKKVADLMDQVIATSDSGQRQKLFEQIKLELTLHAETEEQTFYKTILKETRSKAVEEKMDHADHEHDEIDQYLQTLSTLPVDTDKWHFTFGEFKQAVTHHVHEEENEIFEKAKQYLSPEQAKSLAKEMDSLKKAALKEMTKSLEPAQ
ncbi:hemerythrin domain-containing protein [Asticcacaulis tiandongensis]|uniref:hemerythrin domain-containing protein n=1 Tax=Asticcacaulis tiandongensis TaxID=2565365 RepID=UPI001126D74F|nr:hemerythrin domain-containing protein [Asticcacaulis tiandongensis]